MEINEARPKRSRQSSTCYFLRRALGEREERAPITFDEGAVEARPRDGSVELEESILALAV